MKVKNTRKVVTRLRTRERQYAFLGAIESKFGRARLGVMSNQAYWEDPKRLLFSLSRYKFVSKILASRSSVLELGCGDAFCAPVVAAAVGSLTLLDFDPIFIKDARTRLRNLANVRFVQGDATTQDGLDCVYDGVYALDVLEHISPKKQNQFIRSCISYLKDDGILILGMPTLESQKYASRQSRKGHVNCKSSGTFKKEMERYFRVVIMFHMNDEVVHTGHAGMAHYVFAVCVMPKRAD